MQPIRAACRLSPLFLVLCWLAMGLTGSGCAMLHRTGGTFTVESFGSSAAVTPRIVTAAYHRLDANTADIYLSDIPERQLVDPRTDPSEFSGSLIHIHVFLMPEAGSTPIDATACNVTLRHVVFAGGEGQGPSRRMLAGVYGGGGFLFPHAKPGAAVFSGSISDATHRLVRAAPGFNDLLGPAAMSGRFAAPRNDNLARAMASRLQAAISRLPVVETATEAE